MRRFLSVVVAVAALSLTARVLVTGGSSETVAGFSPSVNVDATTTLVTGGAPTDWHGRASIKRRSDGVLVLAYYSAETHQTNAGALHIRFSDDNGASWTAADTTLTGGAVAGFPMNPPDASAGEDAGEPWLYLAPNGDLIVHMWRVNYGVTTNGTYQARSSDGGETWTTPTRVDFSGVDDDTKVFATDDDFVYDRVIYAAARMYDDATPTNAKTIFIRSATDGRSWEYVSDMSSFTTDTVEVGFEYVGQDTIVAVFRSLNNSNTYQATSTDMGATWGSLTNVNSTVGVSARHRIYSRMHLQGESGWWKDPVLVMVGFQLMTPGSSHPRRNAIWFSPDRGGTWDGPHYLDAQTEDAGYGDVFWNGSGFSVVSYQGTLNAASLKQYDLTVTGI